MEGTEWKRQILSNSQGEAACLPWRRLAGLRLSFGRYTKDKNEKEAGNGRNNGLHTEQMTISSYHSLS